MSLQYEVYLRIQGDSWEYQGITSDLEWDVLGYDFDYYTIYEWRVDTYDTVTELTTTGDTWVFTAQRSYLFFERRSDYDDIVDKFWDPQDEDWEAGDVAGGGRYKAHLIAISYNNIYFGEL